MMEVCPPEGKALLCLDCYHKWSGDKAGAPGEKPAPEAVPKA